MIGIYVVGVYSGVYLNLVVIIVFVVGGLFFWVDVVLYIIV